LTRFFPFFGFISIYRIVPQFLAAPAACASFNRQPVETLNTQTFQSGIVPAFSGIFGWHRRHGFIFLIINRMYQDMK